MDLDMSITPVLSPGVDPSGKGLWVGEPWCDSTGHNSGHEHKGQELISAFLHLCEGSGVGSPNCLCIYFLLFTSRAVPLTPHCELIHALP